MNRYSDYPLSFNFINERPQEAVRVFRKLRPHKGAFIGVTKLDGSFLCDSPEEIFSNLQIGEKLFVLEISSSKNHILPLSVARADGTALGVIPFASAVLLNILISRGIGIWCRAEAKSFKGGMLEIAVSIYCDEY